MNDKKTERFERFSERCPECGGFGTITRWYGGGVYTSTIDCDRCRGRGQIGNCDRCGGTGITKSGESADNQAVASEIECPECRGVGAIGDCPECSGTGITQIEGSDDQANDCQKCNGFGFL